MSPAGSPAGTLLLATLVASLGISAYALDAAAHLDSALDDAVDDALRDLSVDWVTLYDAHGTVTDDAVDTVVLTLRLSGPLDQLDLDDLDARQGQTPLTLTLQDAVQDADGSLEDGTLTDGDLARVSIPLEDPLPAKSTAQIELHHDAGRPMIVEITTPLSLEDGRERLEHRTYW